MVLTCATRRASSYFARFLAERLPRLDYVLNNACQTVRRPAGFFQHLLARETESSSRLPRQWRAALASHLELQRSIEGSQSAPPPGSLAASFAAHAGAGLLHSASLSQRRYLDDDFRGGETLFPAGRYDEDRQQVDLRAYQQLAAAHA